MTIGGFPLCLLMCLSTQELHAQLLTHERPNLYAVAGDDLRTGRCKHWGHRTARVRHNIGISPDVMFTNWTEYFWFGISTPWDIAISRAVVDLGNLAVTIRAFCGLPYANEGCAEGPDVWHAAWCLFSRRLVSATRLLPDHGSVISALGVSAAVVLAEEFPHALAEAMMSFLNGRMKFEAVDIAVGNATLLFRDYVEETLLLGQEMQDHGTSRVARAQFHGDAGPSVSPFKVGETFRGFHRADVLLWLLEGGDGHGPLRSRDGGPPLLVELGVDTGECSQRLLAGHSDFRWLGVDLYPFDDYVDHLLQARGRLKPWLGGRAHLVISKSDAVASVLARGQEVDLLFVDADHSEAAAFKDLAAWAPRVRSGGIVAGHDYHMNDRGVPPAVHRSIPPGATLHLGPDVVFWWRAP